jgi:tripartite-type tricarboxylate transporter receptor subunit TctC
MSQAVCRSAVACCLVATAAAMTMLVAPLPVGAQDVYKGKTITIYVAAGTGGGYGHYAQLMAQHLGRHIPGEPNVIVSFMPGAGGLNGANYLYNLAVRDGTALGVLVSPAPVQALIEPAARYDVDKLRWIGVVVPVIQAFTVMKHAPAQTIDAMRSTEIVAGSTGPASDTFTVPRLINYALGTRIKIVIGYKGTADIALAMRRGEAHAWAGPWTSKAAQFPDLLDPAVATQLLQFGLKKPAGREPVPLLTDLVADPLKKSVVEFLSGPTALGYSLTAPPDVPADRVAILRKAFDAMVKDAAFLDDAKRGRSVVEPTGGEELQAIVARITKVPANVVAEAKRVLTPDGK